MVGRVDEDVPRLDVAVDEPTVVRRVEGVGDLADEPDRTLPEEEDPPRGALRRSVPATNRFAR